MDEPGHTTFVEWTGDPDGASFALRWDQEPVARRSSRRLFEDAFVVRDREALLELCEDGAVLVPGDGPPEARQRGDRAIGHRMWESDRTHLAESRRVVQARDTALVVGRRGVNVVRRGSDGAWRYAISVLSAEQATTKEEQ